MLQKSDPNQNGGWNQNQTNPFADTGAAPTMIPQINVPASQQPPPNMPNNLPQASQANPSQVGTFGSIPGGQFSQQQGAGSNPYNPWAGIERPERMQTIDPKTGLLKNQYQVDYMKNRQLSPWAIMQQQQLMKNYQRGMGDIGAQARSGLQGSWNTLARQGGLTGGGRVALQNAANRSRISGQQNLAANMQGGMTDITGQDITRQLGVDERNINTALGQIDKQYGADYGVYSEEMKKAASQYLADNLPSGAGSDGLGSMIGGVWNSVSRLNPLNPNSYYQDMV